MRKTIIVSLVFTACFSILSFDVLADSVILRPNGTERSDLDHYGASVNYQCVDEAISDGDATYVYNDQVDDIIGDLYQAEELTETPNGTIDNVTVYQISRKNSDDDIVESQGYIKVNGVSSSKNGNVYTTSYQTFTSVFDINPNTDNAWEWTDFEQDDFQFGIAIYNVGSSQGRCTQCWVVINYEPSSSNEINESNNETGTSGYSSSNLSWMLVGGVFLCGGGIGGILTYMSRKRRK